MDRFLRLETLAPAVFVLLWSTGWIVARYSAPWSDPLTFLAIRFAGAILVFATIAVVLRSTWPSTRAGVFHALGSGVLLHTLYLGGVWWAIDKGVPTAISGLLASLQPLMTAMIAYFAVQERLSATQKIGLGLGFAGLLVAIMPKLVGLSSTDLSAAAAPLLVNVAAMLAVTLGTIYQKRFLQEGDLIPVATLQYVGALIAMVPLVLWAEPEMHFVVNWQTIAAMLWSIFGLSLVSIMMLLALIRRGQVSRAAALIYLVPPAVAIQAALFFGEALTLPLIAGTAIVVAGVAMVNRKPKAILQA